MRKDYRKRTVEKKSTRKISGRWSLHLILHQSIPRVGLGPFAPDMVSGKWTSYHSAVVSRTRASGSEPCAKKCERKREGVI